MGIGFKGNTPTTRVGQAGIPDVTYDDMYGQVSSARVPPSSAPTWTNFTIGSFTTQVLAFGVGDYLDIFVQSNHSMALDQVFENHIHWSLPSNSNNGKTFKFEISGIGAGITDDFTEITAVSSEHTVVTAEEERHNYMDIGEIDVPNTTVSSCYIIRLQRIASSGTEADDVYIFYNDSHMKIDTLGSLQESSKI